MAVIAVFAVLLLAVAPGSSARPGVEAQPVMPVDGWLLHNFDLVQSSFTPNPEISVVGDVVGDQEDSAIDYKKAVAFTTGSNDLGYTLAMLSGEMNATAADTPRGGNSC